MGIGMGTASAIAIIGAGPYGLSLAAHLAGRGAAPHIFGTPMRTWRTGMPHGMLLKSEGFASSLSAPGPGFTLGDYCREQGLPYQDIGWPVPVEVFAAYGEAFARRFVPQLDPREVERVEPGEHGFRLRLEGGGEIVAGQVVVATGIGQFDRIPEALAGLPRAFVSHSSRNADYSHYAGKSVVVVGAGASALDAAAALRRAGARATVVSRRPSVRFYTAGKARGPLDRVRAPMTPLGPGWKKLLCVKAPLVFHRMPERFRTAVVQRYLGPAPGWFVRDTVEGHVPFLFNATVVEARLEAGRVALVVERAGEGRASLMADHVISATGYKVDVRRLSFLAPALRAGLGCVDGSPSLSSHFESTVPGLYFVGTPAAYSFGPMLRFACGAEFAASRLTRRLLRTERGVARDASAAPRPAIPALGSGARGSAPL